MWPNEPKACLAAGHAQVERQAEAGELLGLQRLYVCTALSNQPNGGLAEPLKVIILTLLLSL